MNKNRLGIFDSTFKFRMILHTDKKGMLGQFYNFHQSAFRIFSAGNHACFFKLLEIFIVEFLTVTVSF